VSKKKTRKDFENDEDYREYRDKLNTKENERRAKIRPEINASETTRRRKDRLDALDAYSEGDPHCLHCGETQIEFLTLDHISGRDSMGHEKHVKGKALYSRLRREKYPPGMQILCWNWNEIKGKADQWRKTSTTKKGMKEKIRQTNLKKEVLTHYCSGKKPFCVCCGYDELVGLTVDHMYGRKKVPADESKKDGHKLRSLLKKKNYPPNYQVLCFNCNSAKSDKDTCPGLPPKHKLKSNP